NSAKSAAVISLAIDRVRSQPVGPAPLRMTLGEELHIRDWLCTLPVLLIQSSYSDRHRVRGTVSRIRTGQPNQHMSCRPRRRMGHEAIGLLLRRHMEQAGRGT